MKDFDQRSIALSTGVTLNVATTGPEDGDPIIFLHGFPESHRTWRYQLDAFSATHFCLAPDQRGFAKSEKLQGVENYAPHHMVADVIALADSFGIDRFTLAGHDWGGAIAWATALGHPDRVAKLIIANAPHPLLFQKGLIEDRDQRLASTYMADFRTPETDRILAEQGLEHLLVTAMHWQRSPHLSDAEFAIMREDWNRPGAGLAMINWYRASPMIVPAPDEEVERPAFLDAPFPSPAMPVLVVWGLEDDALLTGQIEGLDDLVEDLTLVTVDAGHFVTWEAPEPVTAAMRAFIG